MIFIFILRSFINYEDKKNNDWIYQSLIISIIIVGISIPFWSQLNLYVTASPGLFPEPSHLGFTMGPVLGGPIEEKNIVFWNNWYDLFFDIFLFKSLIIGYFFH